MVWVYAVLICMGLATIATIIFSLTMTYIHDKKIRDLIEAWRSVVVIWFLMFVPAMTSMILTALTK